MAQEVSINDDQSHYEISLTAGQAFLAFVLLLLSLAASFAFGLMIGKGQADERLVVRKDPSVIQEASGRKALQERTVDPGDDFKASPAAPVTKPASGPAKPASSDESDQSSVTVTESAAPIVSASAAPAKPIAAQPAPQAASVPQVTPKPQTATAAPKPQPAPKTVPAALTTPYYAQLLSTGDQKTAEALAAKLIDGGFIAAYVERGVSDKGATFRVRVRFSSEPEARAAEGKLHQFSKDVWITK